MDYLLFTKTVIRSQLGAYTYARVTSTQYKGLSWHESFSILYIPFISNSEPAMFICIVFIHTRCDAKVALMQRKEDTELADLHCYG